MVKLFIADDEEDIREGISGCIDWKANSIEVVGTAEEGLSAYDMILRLKPDIVIIDIRMPGLTGLQVIERIRNDAALNVCFLILSGYDEFDFARQAIRLNVDDYILKPCGPVELLRAVKKVAKRIETTKKLVGRKKMTEDLSVFRGRFGARQAKIELESGITYPAEEERRLVDTLQCGSRDEVILGFDAFFRSVEEKNQAVSAIIDCCAMLYVRIQRMLMEKGLEKNFTIDTDIDVTRHDVTREIKRALQAGVCEAYERISSKKGSNATVARAVRFMEGNYSNDLSLDTVAKAIFVTPSYLSSLFKRVMGINLTDYAHNLRVNHAKGLLLNENKKIYEIAECVGYADEKYFTQVFKRVTGVTPTQFRDR